MRVCLHLILLPIPHTADKVVGVLQAINLVLANSGLMVVFGLVSAVRRGECRATRSAESACHFANKLCPTTHSTGAQDKTVVHKALQALYKDNVALKSEQQASIFLEKIIQGATSYRCARSRSSPAQRTLAIHCSGHHTRGPV